MKSANMYSHRYTVLNVVYLAAYAAAVSFGVMFLMAHGFTSGAAGTILGLATLLAVVVQQPLAAFADRAVRVGLHQLMAIVALVIVPLSIFLFFTETPALFAVGLSFLIVYAAAYILQTLINALGMQLANRGAQINYGFSRGIGCLVYSFVAWLAGRLTEFAGVKALMLLSALLFLTMVVLLLRFPMPAAKQTGPAVKAEKGSVVAFFRRYPQLMIFIGGATLVFTGYFYFSIYMVNIMGNVGGGNGEVGTAMALMAMIEFVPLILYAAIARRFQIKSIFKFATVLVPVKGVFICLAGSVLGVYAAQIFHVGAGLFFVASVYYMNQAVQERDRVQGQAIMIAATLLGNVLASLLGGWGIELVGVTEAGWIANGIGFLGSAIGVVMINRIKLYGVEGLKPSLATATERSQMEVLHEGGQA